jgi:hypothetical protein
MFQRNVPPPSSGSRVSQAEWPLRKSQYNTGGRGSSLRINSRGIKVITHLHFKPTSASQGPLISFPAYTTVRVCTCAGTISLTESATFWNLTPCSLAEVHPRFRGIYCLHLQGRKASNMQTAITISHSAFLLRLILRTRRRKQYIPPKRQRTARLRGATFQKTVTHHSHHRHFSHL